MIGHQNELLLRTSYKKVVVRFVFIGTLAASAYCITFVPRVLPFVPQLAADICAGLLGTVLLLEALAWLVRLARPDPQVRITPEYIEDCRSGLRIPWAEIRRVSFPLPVLLSIVVDDPDHYRRQLHGVHRLFGALDPEHPLVIRLGYLTPGADAIAGYIGTCYPELVTGQVDGAREP